MKYLTIFAILLLVACSSGKSPSELMDEDLSQIRAIQAENIASIENLTSEVRNLSGKVEEMQHSSQGKAQELEKTLAQVSSRVPPPAIVPVSLLEKDEKLISREVGAAAREYSLALRKLRAADFSGAQNGFREFVNQNPQTSFSDNAIFWVALCYESFGDYARAITYYSDVFTNYSKDDFAPAALYRLGENFLKMGSSFEAKDAFLKLKEDFPRSEFSLKAEEKLRVLK